MSALCPYCKKDLEKVPTRKKQCPQCGKDIYVRGGKLLTHREAVFTDAKSRLMGVSLKGVGAAQNIDDLWRVLNENIQLSSEKGDMRAVSSIYMQMAIICLDELRYKDCIQNYLLCSHFSTTEMVNHYRELGLGLKFSDLTIYNYMTSSPVIKSIEELKLSGVDTYNLGVLAVTPFLALEQKLEILQEVFEGKLDRLLELSDEDVEVEKENFSVKHKLEAPVRRNLGCLDVTLGAVILFVVLFR